MENNNNKKSFSYRVGQLFAAILFACVAALLIAVTAKLIFWIV